jgi:hypothetical protein
MCWCIFYVVPRWVLVSLLPEWKEGRAGGRKPDWGESSGTCRSVRRYKAVATATAGRGTSSGDTGGSVGNGAEGEARCLPLHAMKPLSTRAHGLLDYSSVVAFLVAPDWLGWGAGPRRLLRRAAAATLAYSLFTRYELGLIRLLPMPAHLALDAGQAALLCSAAAFLRGERRAIRAAILGVGLGELAIVAFSRRRPSLRERPKPPAPPAPAPS